MQPSVINVHDEIFHANGKKCFSHDINQFDLTFTRITAQDVDITLDELSHSSSLRALGSVHPVELNDLKGKIQVRFIVCVVAAKGQCQIIPKTDVTEFLELFFFNRALEFLSSL